MLIDSIKEESKLVVIIIRKKIRKIKQIYYYNINNITHTMTKKKYRNENKS